jgi:hypothetical protein
VKDEEGVPVWVTAGVTVPVDPGVLLGVCDRVRDTVPVRLVVPEAVWVSLPVADSVLTAVTDPVRVEVGVRVLVAVPETVIAAEPLDETDAVMVGIPSDCVGVFVETAVRLVVAVIGEVAVTVPVELRLGVRVFVIVVEEVTVGIAETDFVVDGEMVLVGVNEGVWV